MPHVRIENRVIMVGEQRVPLMAGEMHYWRLSPANWRPALRRIRQLGLDVVATYIPWQFHELAPQRFDFTGSTGPQRNLMGFLDLLREEGFWVFIRPGPYIYAEWTNMGVPDRVVTMPRMSEEYRRESRVWMEAVADTLRPHFASTSGDGRIVLFQADNEIDLFSHWFERSCGTEGAAGLFHDFLRSSYASVDELNQAWGTRYASIDEARAFASPAADLDPQQRNRARDYWRFQHWATREILQWHVEEYRRLDVDLPILANYYPGGDVQNWRELGGVADVLGIDWYPRHEFGRDANEHRRFLDSCRYQRVVSSLPCIAEFECGIWHGWHDHVGALGPNHYRLLAFSALAAGIAGWNWYMLVNRDNWYFSPINERGELRPELASVFQRLHAVVRRIDPPSMRKLADACVVLDAEQIATDRSLESNAVLRAMHDADADFEIFDPGMDRIAKPLMFYAGAPWLSAEWQRRLMARVEMGATLVLFQQPPLRDERQRACNVLELIEPAGVLSHLGKQVEVDFGGGATCESSGSVWWWDELPRGTQSLVGTQMAGRMQAPECADVWMRNYIGKQWTCGYVQPRGKGRVVLIGLPPSASLIRAIHRWLAAPLHAQAALAGVHTALFAREGAATEWLLIAANLNASAVHCNVQFDPPVMQARMARDLWTGEACPASTDGVVIALDACSGGAWSVHA